jgi:phosphotransacetylase
MTTPGTGKYERLLERCRGIAPIPTAVAYPCDESSLSGAIDAARQGLIVPILVGPAATIADVAKSKGIDISGAQVVDAPNSRAAAARAVELVRLGQAELLMKGSLHSDEVLAAVIAKETGLRTGRRLSHAFLMDVPTYHKVLIVTDAAINIAPTLEDKVDICQNAIDLARTFGVERPKVAILAAVETVTSKMPATLDAAALCKMADRGQIKGGSSMVRSRLTMPSAARRRRRRDCVGRRGRSGHSAGAGSRGRQHDGQDAEFSRRRRQRRPGAGARVPVILTSRADSVRSRIASCAVAVLAAHARRQAPR